MPVIKKSELQENKMQRAEADGVPIFLVRRGGRIFAMAEKCSHLGGPLSKGKFDGETVTCPWHYSKFKIEDGSIVTGPAAYAEPLPVLARKWFAWHRHNSVFHGHRIPTYL